MKQKSHSLEDFYETETLDFEVNKKVGNKSIIEIVKKDIILVKDPTELIRHICNEREMVMEEMCVRIGIDGGQGSVKVVMNIFDPDNPDQASSDGQKFTGVNKMIVLALVRDIPETYENIKLIFKKANLNDIKFKLACDLKILNVILGLSSHGGKHSCMYCDGIQLTLGELRTIQSLKSCHEAFKNTGSDKKKMKEFGNVINECLLEEDDDTKVLEMVPISELHHLMKVVTTLSDVLKQNKDIEEFLKSLSIHWHGYNGGGLDGKNSSRLLNKLDVIYQFVMEHAPDHSPVLETLMAFKEVVDSCFGMNLDPNYPATIQNFNDKFYELNELMVSKDKNTISLGWKGHNLRFHLVDQLNIFKYPLGIFSEQTSEAAHKSMKKTLSRYVQNEVKVTHGKSLMKAVSTYSSMRM